MMMQKSFGTPTLDGCSEIMASNEEVIKKISRKRQVKKIDDNL